MELYINSKPAVKGMEVTTSDGKVGELMDWIGPHKSSSSGKVYVKFPDQKYSSQFYAGVIGGKFRTNTENLYEEIGKEFQDFDFSNEKVPTPPDGWIVTISKENQIEYMEIDLTEDETPDSLKEVNEFVYKKKELVITSFFFKRK